MSFRKILVFILCAMIMTTSVYAATLTSVEINQIMQVGEDLYVVFHANDENGEELSNISSEDIRVEIGGEILETELRDQNSLGIGYVFAVDVSASLTAEQFAAVKEQMKSWAGSLGDQDQMAIVTFGTTVTTVADFTGNVNTLNAIIDGLQPVDNYTMLYSGVMRAVDLAARQGDNLPVRRAVIVLSDGMNDTDGDAVGMQEMRDKAVEAGIPIYLAGVIGEGNSDDLASIGEMARSTGGVVYTGNKDDLGQCFEKLNSYIESGLLVAAKVPGEVADGSQKGVILTVTSGGISATDSLDLRLRAMTEPGALAGEGSLSTDVLTEEGVQGEELSTEQISAPEQAEEPAEGSGLEQTPAADTQQAAGGGFLEEYGLYVYIGCGALLLIFIVCCTVITKRKKKRAGEDKNKSEQDDGEPDDKTEYDLVDGGGDRLVLTDAVMSQSYSCALKDRITIGRHDGNDIVVRDSRVSGSHCEIIRDNDRLYVRDAGSRNGTRVIVNGVRYQVDGISGQEVQIGDEIEIGRTRLEITEA